jgi:hypothetical protein
MYVTYMYAYQIKFILLNIDGTYLLNAENSEGPAKKRQNYPPFIKKSENKSSRVERSCF